MHGFPGESVTIYTPDTGTNRYGRTTVDGTWASPTETVVTGCLFAPQSTSEDNDGRTAVLIGARLYLPTGTTITAADRVLIRGTVYELDGEPSVWQDPYGGDLEGIEAPVRKVTG